MNADMHTNDLISRIERLEGQNRRLKRGALAGLVAAASLFVAAGLMGQAQRKSSGSAAPKAASAPAAPAARVAKNIDAESFTLRDASGRVRAELSMDGEGPSFKLKDQSGAALVNLSLLDGNPSGAIILLSDPQHHGGLSMSILSGQGSQLTLTGARPDIQAHLGVTPDGSAFEISDKDGFTTSIGNGVKATKGGEIKNTSAASVVLYNKERKAIWSTP